MAQKLVAPSGVAAGSKVFYRDGSTDTVAADGTLDVPNGFVGDFLNAGWEYAAADAGQVSSQISVAQSSANSGTATTDSIARSEATSGGLADSTSRSSAVSGGASASIARSSITSGNV